MNKDIAISIQNVSKRFRIPHEKVSSVRGAVVNVFHKKSYEEFEALDDVSFEVKKGEFFGIIGRNGSGKSTLLKVLAGIYKADQGKVEVNGMISPFLELGIGFNPELSGRDNVYLNATVLGLSQKEIDEKFDAIVEFAGLERFIDQKLKNYSSGMQVRLAFAVSVHANRDILLMDEVLAVGDANFQAKCLEQFMEYKQIGKTIILVSHDITTVQRYCDRVLLLDQGNTVAIGPAEEVVEQYFTMNTKIEEQRLNKESEQQLFSQVFDSVEITKVEFLDGQNNAKHIFESGSVFTLRTYFTEHEPDDDFNFGISIWDQDGNYIFGINTFLQSVDTQKIRKQGFFELTLKEIYLQSNTYYAKVAIYGSHEVVRHSFIEKTPTWKFQSQSLSHGMVHFPYSIQ